MANGEASNGPITGALATVWRGSAPGANTNILTDNFKVGFTASAIRISVQLAASSVLNLMASDGTNTEALALNDNAALTAGALHTFTVGARRTTTGLSKQEHLETPGTELSYNFQVETDGVITYLVVDEVQGAVL